MSSKVSQNLRSIILIVIVAFVFVLPVLRLIQMSLVADGAFSLNNYIQMLGEERTLHAIENTIIISVCSTLISVVAGTFFAFLAAYTNMKRKGLMEILVLAPYIIPSYITTLSWSTVFSDHGNLNTFLESVGLPMVNIYSIGGIILVMGICNIPMVYLMVVSMFRKVPKDMEWAARAAGFGTWDVLRKITFHQVAPGIAAGGVLAFLASIDNFAVPAFLGIPSGIPVLSTYIYEQAIGFGPSSFNLAATLSVILSIIALGGTFLQSKIVKKSSGMESVKEDYSVRVAFKERTRKWVEGISLVVLVLVNVFPLLTMITSAFFTNYGGINLDNFTLDNFSFVFTSRSVGSAIRTSLLLAIFTCAVCIIIGTIVAYAKVRKQSKIAKLVENCANLTYALPGIVLALAMIFHWSDVPNVYGTIKILMIAYITRYLVLQIKGSTTALLSVECALEEAGRISGAGTFTIWRKIIIPMIIRPVLSGSFLIFTAALTEMTLSSMLASAGTRTIGLQIFSLQQAGNYSESAAMSTVLVILILIVYALSTWVGKSDGTKKKVTKAAAARKVRTSEAAQS